MNQATLFGDDKLMTIKEAAKWATKHMRRHIISSNISYLVQYGKISKYGNNGSVLVNIDELEQYYSTYAKEKQWKKKLGDGLNWKLSFSEYRESERTKHVHRLHPTKGSLSLNLLNIFLMTIRTNLKKTHTFIRAILFLILFAGAGQRLCNRMNWGFTRSVSMYRLSMQ